MKKPNPMRKPFLFLILLTLCALPVLCLAQDAGGAPDDPSAAATSFIAGLSAKYPAIITILTVIGILRVLFKPIMSAIETAVANDPNKAKALQTFEGGTVFKIISWVLDFGASIKLKPTITNAVVSKADAPAS
jgi:hypothetical protein